MTKDQGFNMDDLREKLADLEHERWSRWMIYLFSLCEDDGYGGQIIPMNSVQRWMLQATSDYSVLTEKEKDSDRKEADNTLALLKEFKEIK